LQQQLLSSLDQEIKHGMVDVSKNNERVVIRFPERFAFPTASETLTEQFTPVIAKIVALLEKTQGSIIVAGHTDDVPINNERFRSNWELSSARAVSVIHALLAQSNIPATRFVAEGHAETQPLAPNDNATNRASNRRVEISIKDTDDLSKPMQRNTIRRDVLEPLHPADKE
jgi:chemotaxis protein MotB